MTSRLPWGLSLGLLISSALLPSAYAAECDQPRTSDAVAHCLGGELRSADAKINESYQALMRQLSEPARTELRSEQRAWIKERDAVCNLSGREADREQWYKALLTDYRKTVCVTRYTRMRTAELDQMVANLTAAPRPTQARTDEPKNAQPPRRQGKEAYQIVSQVARDKGRWYFEVLLKAGEIANFSPTAVWMGCGEGKTNTGAGGLVQIRASDGGRATARMGFALDLEDGKLYAHQDGEWVNGEPGSSKGLDVKLARPYRCGIDSTALVAPMVENAMLQVNFGERSFAYPMPNGYRPLGEP
jgi:uncharacterized protein YecT (DUF1311 family)